MRYNNIIPDELGKIRSVNYITQTIERAVNTCNGNAIGMRKIVYGAVKVLYEEDRDSKTYTKSLKGTLKTLEVKVFNYNGRDYYWWDLVSEKGDLEASGLEYYPFIDDRTSFVLWASREGQPPFVWREGIRKK